jgi:hypothetical protein
MDEADFFIKTLKNNKLLLRTLTAGLFGKRKETQRYFMS